MNVWPLILLFAVFCGGSAGAFVRIIQGNLMLVLAWRQMLSALLILPLGFRELGTFSPRLIVAGLIHTVAVAGFYLSCHLTKLSHTYLLANMSPVVVLIYGLYFGQSYSKKTYIHLAVLLTASAMLVTGFSQGSSSLLGDCFGIVSAAGFAGICLYNHRIKDIPPWPALTVINAVSAVVSLCLSLAFENTQVFSWDAHTGLFGLFTAQQFKINLLNAVLTGIFCATLISLCSRYLEPMIVTTGLLFEPLTATFIGYMLNIERDTSLVTWLLMLVIINSLYEIINDNQQLEEVGRSSRSGRLSCCSSDSAFVKPDIEMKEIAKRGLQEGLLSDQ